MQWERERGRTDITALLNAHPMGNDMGQNDIGNLPPPRRTALRNKPESAESGRGAKARSLSSRLDAERGAGKKNDDAPEVLGSAPPRGGPSNVDALPSPKKKIWRGMHALTPLAPVPQIVQRAADFEDFKNICEKLKCWRGRASSYGAQTSSLSVGPTTGALLIAAEREELL